MGNTSSAPAATSTSASVFSTTTTSTIVTATPTSTSCAAVSPPAPTQTGIVSPCTQWYTAQSGDYCQLIASNYNISLNTFYAWNPAVGSNCQTLYAGYAYCVSTSCASGSAPATTPKPTTLVTSTSTRSIVTTYTSTCAPAHATVNPGKDAYTAYYGDGSPSNGWPCISKWVDFNNMWNNNLAMINISCAQFNQANNSPKETSDLKTAIINIAKTSNVDNRFVLAIVMQESKGCVRVPSTYGVHLNPGLMQSDQGTGSCNTGLNGGAAGTVQNPCPTAQINQMIQDGTNGTGPGQYGLAQYYQIQGLGQAQGFYRTARSYNSGSVAANGDLSSGPGTASYASDVANRLTGWVFAQSTFQ